ncbi:MAG: alkaline phosphatase family protein [Armatimonadetes bacterium]|nr:alkaline phosphatase family protein [Armatimonadota bacterium]
MVRSNQIRLVRLFLFISIILVSGCNQSELQVTGNVDKNYKIQESGNLKNILENISKDIEYAFLIGKDGTAAYISKPSFSNIQIQKKAFDWFSYTDSLPDFCNIKYLTEICVYQTKAENSLFILKNDEQIEKITPFSARVKEFELLGISKKNNYFAKKFYWNNEFKLNFEKDSLLAIFSDGNHRWFDTSRNEELDNLTRESHYFILEEDTVLALWNEPPEMDAYKLHHFLKEKYSVEPMLLIFLDGVGWRFWEHTKIIDKVGFLSQFDIKPMRAAYPPKTKFNYWAVGTGEDFSEESNENKIFSPFFDINKKGLIIEGDKLLFHSPFQQISVLDFNNDGNIDEEIYQEARKHLQENNDFMLVHFHSVDDVGHKTGAYSNERIEQLKLVGEYIKDLSANWKGQVYIFSDHGMHTESGKGVHYLPSEEDMIAIWGRIK